MHSELKLFSQLHRSLDYENLVRHTLIILARDNGIPSLSANLTLVVDVQDVNDNHPVFEHESYSANVLESEAVNTKVKIGILLISNDNIGSLGVECRKVNKNI